MKKILVVTDDTSSVSKLASLVAELPEDHEVVKLAHADFEKFLDPFEDDPPVPSQLTKDGSALNLVVDGTPEASETDPDATTAPREGAMPKLKTRFRHGLLILDIDHYKPDQAVKAVEAYCNLYKDQRPDDPEKPLPPLRVFLLSFDHPDFKLDDYLNDQIADVIFKPIDRSLFLQKTEMFLSDAPAISSRFLFKQASKLRVDVAKLGRIEEVADAGIAVASPTMLKAGVVSRLYSNLFGVPPRNNVIARVAHSKPNPKKPGEFLSYFLFFGIAADQLTTYRRAVLKEKAAAEQPISVVQLAEATRKPFKNIAVIDFEADARATIESTVERNFVNAKIHNFPSYASFLKRILEMTPAEVVSPEITAEALPQDEADQKPALPNGKKLEMKLGDEFGLVSMLPILNNTDEIFGVAYEALLSTPGRWIELVHPEDRADLEDIFAIASASGKCEGAVRFKTETGTQHYTKINLVREKAGNNGIGQIMRLRLELIEQDQFEAIRGPMSLDKLLPFDAIWINVNFIRVEPKAWLEGLQQTLAKHGLLNADKHLALFLIGGEHHRHRPEEFVDPAFTGYVLKPLDRRFISQNLAAHVPGLISRFSAGGLPFHPMKLEIMISKPMLMNEVSEYGFQVVSYSPFREGIFLRFFSPIFSDQKGQGILGRCYHHVQDQNNKTEFHCFFTFYGASDTFLKNIRQWIRENHVAQNERQS